MGAGVGAATAMKERRMPFLLRTWILAAVLPSSLQAEELEKKQASSQPVEVLDIKFPETLAQNLPRTGGWIPVYIELRSTTGRTETVVLEGTVTFDGKKRFTTTREVEVSAGAPRRAWLELRAAPDEGMEQQVATVEVRNRAGDTIRRSQPWSLQPFDRRVISLMVVGQTLGYLTPWPGRLGTNVQGMDESLYEAVEGYNPRQIPDSALGYASADLVVIRDLGDASLEKAQLEALEAWLRTGGCVILVPTGRSMEIFRSELAKRLLGDLLVDPQPVEGFVPRALFYSDESSNRGTGLTPLVELDAAESGSYTLLDPLRDEMRREIHAAADPTEVTPVPGTRRIYAEVPLGKGHVGVFTVDDHTRLDADFLRNVWARIISWRLSGPRSNLLRSSASFQMGGLESVLKDSSRDVGLPFITGLVVAYLLLVGPGLYLYLKQKNRLPAVIWVEPLVVVLYLGVIFGTAYITKGVLTKTRLWTFLVQSAADPYMRRHSYLTIYSGADATYGITCPSGAVVHPMFLNQNDERPIEIVKAADGSAAVRGFRLAHWEQGHLANLDFVDHGGAGLSVERIGAEGAAADEVRGFRVTSSLAWPILEGYIAWEGEARPFGRIDPGQSIEVPVEKTQPRAPPETSRKKKADVPVEASWRRLAAHAESGRSIGEGGRLIAAALLERADADFRIDRMSTLKERLDLYLLFER